MNNLGSSRISTAILLVTFLLVAVTIASVITGRSGIDFSSKKDNDYWGKNVGFDDSLNKDMEKILNDVLDDITTYIKILDKMGKFYDIDDQLKIQKIVIMIKPLIIQDIDISDLTIKINNGENVRVLDYSGNAEYIESNPLFEHLIWEKTSVNNFSLIITKDKDRSLINNNVINDDMAYIIIKLSEDFFMVKGDSLIVTLFPSSGITRTTLLEAPLPMNRVITFE
jgi:archaellin